MSNLTNLHGPGLLLSDIELRRARRSMWRRLSFNERLESAYRESQDRRYRWPRTIFFGIAAVSFLLSPATNHWFFKPTDESRGYCWSYSGAGHCRS